MMVRVHAERERLRRITLLLYILFVGPIHPASNARSQWDLFILVLISYACLVEPYIVCFGVNTDISSNVIIGLMEVILDSIFLLDIFICMRSGFFTKKGEVVMDRDRSLLHYLKSWFIIDVISAVPWDAILASKQVASTHHKQSRQDLIRKGVNMETETIRIWMLFLAICCFLFF